MSATFRFPYRLRAATADEAIAAAKAQAKGRGLDLSDPCVMPPAAERRLDRHARGVRGREDDGDLAAGIGDLAVPPTVAGECEDTRAAWGAVCQTCGQTLPLPLPWEYGRPCAKTSLDRGRGWDGREAPQHTAGERQRWARSTPGRPIRVNPRTPVGGWDTQP